MTTLPIAAAPQVRRYARRVALRHRRALTVAVLLHVLAAASGLVAPRLIGTLVADAAAGRDVSTGPILLILVLVVVQAVLVGLAGLVAAILGEQVLAEIRTEFVDGVLALPLSLVERAGTGDVVTRSTRDVSLLALAVRQAVPDTLLAAATIVLTAGALLLLGPLLLLPALAAVPALWLATRWYLARAREGYLRENASYSAITEGLADTVEGARTVEAYRLSERRIARTRDDIARSYAAQRYTLALRTVFLPVCDVSYVLPVAATLLLGGFFVSNGWAELSVVVTAVLYVQQLVGPIDVLLYWLNELQVGGAALGRLVGVAAAAKDRRLAAPPAALRRTEADGHVAVRGVSYSYRGDRLALDGIDLTVEPGERLAVVGASGAGKSTLGRVIAGIHQPRTGSVTVDGVPVHDLPLAERRRRIALVTQEHHVFAGTLRDNLIMACPDAGDEDIERAMKALSAWDWVASIGLDAEVGSGRIRLDPVQAQQVALGRLILADPHTLVLDEATALLAPREARATERSLNAALRGRTVIAIAHRLHTAHDSDRIAVMERGRIVELGRHDELIRLNRTYASLWRSWRSEAAEGAG